MLVRVLGPLELEVDGVAHAVSGVRPRALLTALLLRPSAVVPAHALAESIWGDAQPDKVNNALHMPSSYRGVPRTTSRVAWGTG